MTTEPTPSSPDKSAAAADGAVELPFQAEVQQVLGLVINSLYTHKEVFLRELVSNAADALDKARFLGLTRDDVAAQVGEPRITLRLDEEARTLTVEDNGVGMTRDEIIQNLGTIAKSGSLEFLRHHAEIAKQKSASLKLIGQFGVGFYSAFMVGERVDVKTRSMLPGSESVLWRSTGSGTFTILPGDRDQPGTEIVIHLKDDAVEYAKTWRVEEIIHKYSDFVHFPIYLNDELANRSKAIWSLPKGQVEDEQHTEFFRRITGFEEQTPLLRVHTSVDAPVQFHALVYVPEKAPLDLFTKDHKGLRLYAKRVLIVEDCDKLVPTYLRFLRGVVDSEDLSLNVSREMLQEDKTLHQIEQQLVKQVLRGLKDLADADAEKYAALWGEFGKVLKEGLTIDWKNKDAIADLCRFESMKTEAGKVVSLRQYVEAMPEAQKEIYFVTGAGRREVDQSPHLEAFRRRGYDVLFLTDPIDEWVVRSLPEYEKRRLRSVTHGDLDLGEEPAAADKPAEKDVSAAVVAVRQILGDRVKDVRLSKRLTDSASCLVADEGDPGANMERILEMLEKGAPKAKRILEINPTHPFVESLATIAQKEPGSDRVTRFAEMLLDQALLAEGVLEDPAALVKKIQRLLDDAAGAAAKG